MPVGHVENLLLPSFLPTPLLLRSEKKRLMVLARLREDEAPKVCHSYNGGNALGYNYTGVSAGGMISRVLLVEGLNITDRYEVLACVVILEHTCHYCLSLSH